MNGCTQSVVTSWPRFYCSGRVEAAARRRIGLPPRELSEADYERIEDLIDFERMRRAVRESFAGRTSDQHEAVALRVVEGRSYPQNAEDLSCTEEVARARVSRASARRLLPSVRS